MQQGGTVYIMSSPNRGVVYTGVTSDLVKRVWEHRNKQYADSFTAKYNCVVLVYYRHFQNIFDAIAEEKRIKGGSRGQKNDLINEMNPDWKDLLDDVLNGL